MERLFQISLIASVLGIVLLLFLANFTEQKTEQVEKINEKMLNERIRIQGKITEIRDEESFKIISVNDRTGEIDVLCKCREIEDNQFIEVTGKVQEYMGKLQIEANKIRKITPS